MEVTQEQKKQIEEIVSVITCSAITPIWNNRFTYL